MATPSNNRNRNARPTGGQAGGRAGRPKKPVAGTKDKTVRVPKEWNAKVVDPTNNRGGDQRATGGRGGGRAGKPSGDIARPAAKPAVKPTAKPPSVATVPKGAAKATVRGVASRALILPAIAAQIADIKGGFETLASHPFLKGKGGESGSGTTSANSSGSRRAGQNSSNVQYPQGTPSGPGSRRGAAAVAGDGRGVSRSDGRPNTSVTTSATKLEKLFKPDGSRANYGLDKAPPAPKLPAAVTRSSSSNSSSTPSRGSSTQRRASSSSSSSSTASPSTSTSGTPAKPGQKWSDFNPNRGTSKTNNPLMKDMVARMKDREDKAQASSASKLTSKFNTESNFSGEKVDGSKYLDSLKKKKKKS